jgi:hypothetical protein
LSVVEARVDMETATTALAVVAVVEDFFMTRLHY